MASSENTYQLLVVLNLFLCLASLHDPCCLMIGPLAWGPWSNSGTRTFQTRVLWHRCNWICFACMIANYPVAMEGLLTINCGATTLRLLLVNCSFLTNVEPKLITIQWAMDSAIWSCLNQDILRVWQTWNTPSNLYASFLCQRIETRSSRSKSTCSIKLLSYSWQGS